VKCNPDCNRSQVCLEGALYPPGTQGDLRKRQQKVAPGARIGRDHVHPSVLAVSCLVVVPGGEWRQVQVRHDNRAYDSRVS
jgi:hypothetical protein